MSTLKLDTIASRDGTESTDVTNVINGSAKAWVNFNGTGTVAIRESFNVSSITDNATGMYSINFTTSMTDTNYAYTANGKYASDGGGNMSCCEERVANSRTTSLLKISSFASSSGASLDFDTVVVVVFR